MLTTVTVTPAGRPMSLVIKAPGASGASGREAVNLATAD